MRVQRRVSSASCQVDVHTATLQLTAWNTWRSIWQEVCTLPYRLPIVHHQSLSLLHRPLTCTTGPLCRKGSGSGVFQGGTASSFSTSAAQHKTQHSTAQHAMSQHVTARHGGKGTQCHLGGQRCTAHCTARLLRCLHCPTQHSTLTLLPSCVEVAHQVFVDLQPVPRSILLHALHAPPVAPATHQSGTSHTSRCCPSPG